MTKLFSLLSYASHAYAVVLTNPLGAGSSDPNVIIGNIIKGLLGVVGTAALVLFIYGGVLMMISAGDSGKVTKGRDTMVWAAIGIAVIFASYSITSYVLGIVSVAGGVTP